ncbi:MAG: sirohydrochlorin chelatase [Gemmataceae bacterium]|nr:sirohydrochlorin chelatase [Gemmataceae bacterium]MDW8265758.1 sirohydrochlorin chelatase [Gemmataceae bacterium]
MTQALLISGHGSRDPEGVAEFLDMARHFRAYRPDLPPVEISFLEFARPTIQEGIDRLVARGASSIVVLPGVLMAAGHAKNDMASEVRHARLRYPHVPIHMGRSLDLDHRLLQLCRLRYEEALADRPPIPASETLLLVVGRGSSDPDANSNIAKVAAFLREGYPTGWAAWAYSGVARPLVEEALPVCARAGFRRIVVQPYFLFTGILLKRIYAQVEELRQARRDLDVVATPHLQSHPLLLETFLDRAREAVEGTGHMNCSLCQYRVPIVGHEHRVGEPQQPHHHHVQGLYAHVHHLDDAPHAHRPHHHHHAHASRSTLADIEWTDPHPWSEALREQLQF